LLITSPHNHPSATASLSQRHTSQPCRKHTIITAVGREVVGFIWAIGVKVEAASKQPMAS